MSTWIQFFKDAGIPSSAAKRYASVFEDNRMTKDLLPDLSKEILLDMGIKVMGDILCILKQASKEVRKTERANSDGGQGLSPPAHSTTSGHPDPVSTTSGLGRRSKGEHPKERRGHRHHHQTEPDFEDVEIEPEQIINPLPMLRSDQVVLETAAHRPHKGSTITESYSTAAYKSKQKRQATMYSDEGEEFSPPKQPRVVILPGEGGQEMYTATALQRAAAIAASVAIATQQESPSLQKSNKMAEASGIVPTDQGKVRGGSSVFSRLDSDGPVSSSLISSAPSLHPQSPPPARITMDTSKNRVAVDTSKPRTIRLGKNTKATVSTSDTKPVQRTHKPSIADRLGEVSSSKYSEGPGLRSTSSKEPPLVRSRVGDKRRLQSDVSSSSSTSVRQPTPSERGVVPRSMVADEVEYQTQRQSDIRLRLEMREQAKAARRRGPLEGRLEQHNVFGRLE